MGELAAHVGMFWLDPDMDSVDNGLCNDSLLLNIFAWTSIRLHHPGEFNRGTLSKRLAHKINSSPLQGLSISRHGPILTHLFFTYDLILYLKATTTNAENKSYYSLSCFS